MSSPTFIQPERRSYLLPILIALAALAVAIVLALHYFPATSIDLEHIHTDLLPTSTHFKSQSIVVAGSSEDVLFVASTVKIDNHTKAPIFVDGFELTFTNPDGAQLNARGETRSELQNSEVSFPALQPLAKQPLLRDTSIDPGKSAQGTLVFSLPITQAIWNQRKTATIKVDIYHLPALYQDIPNSQPAAPAKP